MKRGGRNRERHKLQRVCLEMKAQDVKEKLLDYVSKLVRRSISNAKSCKSSKQLIDLVKSSRDARSKRSFLIRTIRIDLRSGV